jgi:hypothetical protein
LRSSLAHSGIGVPKIDFLTHSISGACDPTRKPLLLYERGHPMRFLNLFQHVGNNFRNLHEPRRYGSVDQWCV